MTQASFSVDTLTEFLTVGETHYYIFDLGRLVRQIPNDEFAAIEAGQRPYPTPAQQHACLAIVFWRKDTPQQHSPYIWFAKFPLDERGLISHAARQHYLQIIMQALGRDITAEASPQQEELLQQNPYIFTPSEDKRAAFHAQVSCLLEQPPSIYFDDVQSFVLGQRQPAEWQQLGIQGVHDLAARLDQQTQVKQAIHQQFQAWPAGFIKALAAALEHQVLPVDLQQNLQALLTQAVSQHQQQPEYSELLLPLLRSLSASVVDAANTAEPRLYAQLSRQIQRLLATQSLPVALEQDILIVLAARCWPLLQDQRLREIFLERLSQHGALFSHLFADLVTVPMLRMHFLLLLRDPSTVNVSVQEAIARLKNAMLKRTQNEK